MKHAVYPCVLFLAMLTLIFTSCQKDQERDGPLSRRDYRKDFTGTYDLSGSYKYSSSSYKADSSVTYETTYGDTVMTIGFTLGRDSDLVVLDHPVLVQRNGSFVRNSFHETNPIRYKWINGHFVGDSVYLEITSGHVGYSFNLSGTRTGK